MAMSENIYTGKTTLLQVAPETTLNSYKVKKTNGAKQRMLFTVYILSQM